MPEIADQFNDFFWNWRILAHLSNIRHHAPAT